MKFEKIKIISVFRDVKIFVCGDYTFRIFCDCDKPIYTYREKTGKIGVYDAFDCPEDYQNFKRYFGV